MFGQLKNWLKLPRKSDAEHTSRKPDCPPEFAVGDRVQVIDNHWVAGFSGAVGTVVKRPHNTSEQQAPDFVYIDFDEDQVGPDGVPCISVGLKITDLRRI